MLHFFGTAEACDYPDDLAQESQKQLELFLQNRGVTFEGKPLPVQIRPYVYDQALSETCRNYFERFFNILEKTEQLYKNNVEVQSYFGLQPCHHELVTLNRNIEPFNQLCRFDFMFDSDNNPQIYETNTACPGGLLLTPIIASLVKETPLFELLLKDKISYSLFPHQKKDYFVEVASESFRQMTGKLPNIAILNSRHNTLTNEISLMAESLTRAGIENEVCFVEDLEYSDNEVVSPKKKLRIDICFQKFDNALSSEGIAHFGATRDSVKQYIEAIRDAKVIVINPFVSHYLIEQKSTLAFLHDPEMQKLFEPKERDLIKKIIPYTVLKSRATTQNFTEKENWVLKKSLDTRGRNVIMGSEVDESEWLAHLKKDSINENYILQQRVPSEIFKEKNSQFYISHAAFLVQGKYVGMFPRFSNEPLTNVGRNGFLGIPILRER